MPSKPSSAPSASSDAIQYGSSTSVSRRRTASTSIGMRACARTVWERSPTRAMVAVDMPGIVHRLPVHVQRSFGVVASAILMEMDPRFLRTFVTVVRLESFSAAARELGYTQSGVSQHVAALEADLGMTLLHRRPVAPTEAGARLLEHAGAILLRLDAARAEVVRTASGPPGRAHVGATPLSAGAAARALAASRRTLPAVETTVRVGERDAIAVAVATGDLDAGIVDGIAAPGDPLRLPDTGLPVAEFVEEPLAI